MNESDCTVKLKRPWSKRVLAVVAEVRSWPAWKRCSMLEPVKIRERLCKYCKRPHPGSSASYAENPWCAECLPERLAKAQEKLGPVKLVHDGRYIHFVPEGGNHD